MKFYEGLVEFHRWFGHNFSHTHRGWHWWSCLCCSAVNKLLTHSLTRLWFGLLAFNGTFST